MPQIARVLSTLRAMRGAGLPDVTASQWWPAHRIAEYQSRRLREIVARAYEDAPFYRAKLDGAGLKPSSIQGLDDLAAIPVTTRRELVGQAARVLIPAAVHRHATSGGTTGERLRWAVSRSWQLLFERCLYRGLGWAGVTRRTRLVSLHSRVIGQVSRRSLIVREAFDVRRIEEELARVRRFRPEAGYCYASSAFLVARYLLDRGQRLPLRVMVTTSDALLPHQVPVIEEAFQCPVFDNYGCNDGGAWGAQCAHRQGFHHDAERSVLEFVDGAMVATDLWNEAFPFLRYVNGDRGGWLAERCSCGRPSPLFGVDGRAQDMIVTPHRVLTPTTVSQLLLYRGIDDARLVQRSANEVELMVVRNAQFDKDAFEAATTPLWALLGEMRRTVAFTDDIPRELSGKHRVSVNLSGASPDDTWRCPTVSPR